jgi:hypothetical protein
MATYQIWIEYCKYPLVTISATATNIRPRLYPQREFYINVHAHLSAFRPWGVPGPTSKLSPRVPAQMGRRETEHEGGEKRGGRQAKRGNPRPSCCPAPRSGALAVGGYKRPRGGRARDSARHPVLPRGQPPRKRALVLPFIGVRRGPRCTVGGVAMC